MKKLINNKTIQKVFFLLCFTVAYLLVLFNRHFYDDEIGSIVVLNQAQNIVDLYLNVNTWDVSPPFSYIIFFLLVKISWWVSVLRYSPPTYHLFLVSSVVNYIRIDTYNCSASVSHNNSVILRTIDITHI